MIHFSEENIKLFRNKIFLFLNYIIPGVVALEIFFKKGFFSFNPENLYQFLLYILWCFILSIPYNFIDTISSRDIFNYIKKKYFVNIPEESQEFEKLMESKKEEFEQSDSQLQFIFTLLYPFSTYIFYKLIIYIFQIKPFLNINIGLIMYCLCTLLTYVTIFPIAKIISKKLLIRYLEKNSRF